MNIEHGTFTPLIFSLNGGMGPECAKYHQHLAQSIADKSGEKYSSIITLIRCKLSYLILRSCLMCVRGSRPHVTANHTSADVEYNNVCTDARLVE